MVHREAVDGFAFGYAGRLDVHRLVRLAPGLSQLGRLVAQRLQQRLLPDDPERLLRSARLERFDLGTPGVVTTQWDVLVGARGSAGDCDQCSALHGEGPADPGGRRRAHRFAWLAVQPGGVDFSVDDAHRLHGDAIADQHRADWSGRTVIVEDGRHVGEIAAAARVG